MLTAWLTEEAVARARILSEASVRVAWVAAVCALVLLLPRALGFLRAAGAARALPWLGILAVALVARLVVAHPTVVNENRHGEMIHLRVLDGGHLETYGPAYFETYRALLSILPPRIESTLAVQAVLGSLVCVLAGMMVVLLLGGTRREGLLAAAVLAVLPVHVRVSHSESLFVLATFLVLAALCLAASAMRSFRPAAWWAAWMLAAIAAQVRPEYVFFPAFLLLAAVAARPADAPPVRPMARHLVGAVAVCGLLLAPRFVVLLALQTSDDAVSILAPAAIGARLLSQDHLFTNPRLFPVALTVLGLIGLWAVAARHRLGALWIGAALAYHTSWFLSLQPNLGNVLRFQHAAVHLWAMLAAAGTCALVRRAAPGAPRLAAAAAATLAVTASALPGARLISERFDKDEEFHYLRAAAAGLPDRGHLVLPDDSAFGDGRILGYFLPEVLPGGGAGWRLHRQSAATAFDEAALAALDGPVFYYRGLWSYEFTPEEVGLRARGHHGRYRANRYFDHEETTPGMTAWAATEDRMMRAEVAALEARYRLEPVTGVPEHTFDTRPYHRWIVPQRRITIGFYRIAGARGARPTPAPGPGPPIPPPGPIAPRGPDFGPAFEPAPIAPSTGRPTPPAGSSRGPPP